eukprot:8361996-Alexandrium_andersonii.AAC.1
MTVSDFVHLHAIGLPMIRSVKAWLLASIMRAAHCAVSVWTEWADRLKVALASPLVGLPRHLLLGSVLPGLRELLLRFQARPRRGHPLRARLQ